MKKNLLCSVVILSYKQKKYIKDAIESVLMQKVNFKYELLLSDDYSNDGTLEIMKEYENKYPEIIKVIDRGKNLGATNNILDSGSRTKGKYITFLEGDDYWCNENKLQTQVDFLEKNSDYIGYSHKQEGRNLKNELQGYFPINYKYKDDFIVDGVNDLLRGKQISYTATVYRNIFLNKKNFKELKYLLSIDPVIEDAQMCSYLASLGKIYVSKSAWMIYRMRTNDGDSNFNSSHNVSEIELSNIYVNSKIEEFFDYKYNYVMKIGRSFAICVGYDLLNFNYKHIGIVFSKVPKNHKISCILLFPIQSISILIYLLRRKIKKFLIRE